ncbi:FAD-binding domain-containing protein [Neurospora crassa]|uniref:Delta(24)-sterol reductase n=1 Tax=Neurospora crassa (strain ATCC 24698 / 74-OR23-1A / CBS 708.71 / DSM 1257 / FGSC 987) TaxID=367110 RepID=Q7S6F1_NEUCR|nr:galactose-1-phosphate uridylyltransferase [Neurospora crassa OR74A]EAA31101.1 galactose-1-phosphate uridylyltransferase [Neurospora crassa OR74A]KHE86857.1 FAD-binding domain-containing protein [Neurospora crassa]|eukprot:XP_960337.1 galactose-1-phosphate uridylyltransferase [Neurospora crassa OR74A]
MTGNITAALERHASTVTRLSSQISSYYAARLPYRIFHGSTNSTRPPTQKGTNTKFVDISSLNNVLSVDRATKTALVEPNVPMDKLVEATLPHGLVPPIVMEFPGITAGGGFAGTAGESSSFRHGFFDDTVREVEMVLGNGEVVKVKNPDLPREVSSTATAAENGGDLFRGAAGAVGTLGTTTLLEVQLMDAKKFVKTEYKRANSVAEAIRMVREETQNAENDYVDGILFSKDHGVIVTGKLVNELPSPPPSSSSSSASEKPIKPQTFSGPWDPWFYLHCQSRTLSPSTSTTPNSSPVVATDYVPLAEYLFRYDRGGFWVGAAAFQYFSWVPFTKLTRWFLDDFLHTRMMYRALHGSGESARFVVQDIAMPFETSEEFINYTSSSLGIWPLWLCPLKRRAPPTFHPHTTRPGTDPSDEKAQDDMMLNIGVWGWGPDSPQEFVAKNIELENKVHELGGMKWFYAHTYYEQEKFWKMYGGRTWYDALRKKYHAEHLPTVWDKIHVDADKAGKKQRHWLLAKKPIGGFYGIWKSIQSKDYFLHRKAQWKWKGE